MQTSDTPETPDTSDNSRPVFSLNGYDYELVKFKEPKWVQVWEEKSGFNTGSHEQSCKIMDVNELDQVILKDIGIWDKIPEDIRKGIGTADEMKAKAAVELMEKARAGKRARYPDIPKQLTCTKCGKKFDIPPSVTARKIEVLREKKGLTYSLEDYLKVYECSICKPPRRGRATNPEFVGLPKVMKCKCGFEATVQATQLKKKAEKLGVTIQSLIDGYVCRKCNPRKGPIGKARVSTGKCVPTKLTCKCGKFVVYPLNIVQKRAEEKGVTVEEMIKSYQCQKCHPTKGRNKK